MTLLTLFALGLVVVATSFLSGIFGMAGGLILLGVLLLAFDVAPAMVLFGTTQTAANGWRAILWRRYVHWPVIPPYLGGCLLVFALMRFVSFLPGKAFIYLAIGFIPLLTLNLPERFSIDILKPGRAFLSGLIIMPLQLVGGGAGTVLDTFFQRSALDRRSIVATKAVTQVAAHLLRIAYFGSFVASFDAGIPLWVYGAAVLLAMLGTSLAALVLHRMSNESFRAWSRRLIVAVSVSFIGRGTWLLFN
ncbi:MAG: TSUP family transporter [Hyphomicrobiaceae bacterium]|nr:MAG: TSUP family transporter [Hyphomicrobiaceae bacterium]